ncbi:MAG: agmatine deiminase family protein [Candidatus Peribacteraceae bacterium]|nr:agmatine deiminase family protein [Candidatus Peribacteraceae bacterium]
MPAEWEPHEATILTWPHSRPGEHGVHPHWPGLFDQVPAIWARMVKELEVGEDVHVLINDDETEKNAKSEMKKANVQGNRVHLHRIPNNFSWARDHGPIVVVKQPSPGAAAPPSPAAPRLGSGQAPGEGRLFLDWGYNAWGGQWEYELDDQVPTLIARKLGQQSLTVPMILEGGSIDVNGLGTLLTTEDCLLNPNRNPGMTKEQIEQSLKDHLGVTNVLWLGKGIMGDDTSGHVDDLARFVGPRTVVTIINENSADPDYAPLQENLRRLQSMKDQDGHALEIITTAQPKPVLVHGKKPSSMSGVPDEGFRIPASYANFYVANECVLLPVWNDPNDAAAIETLQKCFPHRRIVPIDSRVLTWGWGSFHCVTQQIPAS